jgi:uncharacterized protein (TIGR02453 family)
VAGYFTNDTFRFLRELAANNDRSWFQENKPRYEKHVKAASIELITDFGPRLREVSPHFVADPSPAGGSLFRIYRDTRFSKDKSPYKTSIGIRFTHERGKDVHAPGYYLHIGDDGCYAALGIWRPDRDALTRIREAIVEDPAAWKRARDAKAFAEGWEMGGDALVRAPRGFDPDHPLIGDIRRKDFIASRPLTKKAVKAEDLPSELASLFRTGASFQRYICRTLDLNF